MARAFARVWINAVTAALLMALWAGAGIWLPRVAVAQAALEVGGPFELIDQHGRPFSSAALAGHPYAIFFGFTNCPDVCPTTLLEMSMTDGIMKMRKLARGLEIKPGQSVELKPGGYHLMFMGLRGGLKEGQTIKGTLVFEKAGSVDVEYRVAAIGAKSSGHKMH